MGANRGTLSVWVMNLELRALSYPFLSSGRGPSNFVSGVMFINHMSPLDALDQESANYSSQANVACCLFPTNFIIVIKLCFVLFFTSEGPLQIT